MFEKLKIPQQVINDLKDLEKLSLELQDYRDSLNDGQEEDDAFVEPIVDYIDVVSQKPSVRLAKYDIMKYRLYKFARENNDTKLMELLDELRLDKPNRLWDLSELDMLPLDLVCEMFKSNDAIGLSSEV
ncbi:MAG: hypothetical protein QM497_03335 [Sulfurimonas sp.]